jgi:hypothetical protein
MNVIAGGTDGREQHQQRTPLLLPTHLTAVLLLLLLLLQ